jgi:hypothetical protein
MEKHSDSIRKNVDGISDEIRKAQKALDVLHRKAKSTLRALNVELTDEAAEATSPRCLPQVARGRRPVAYERRRRRDGVQPSKSAFFAACDGNLNPFELVPVRTASDAKCGARSGRRLPPLESHDEIGSKAGAWAVRRERRVQRRAERW